MVFGYMWTLYVRVCEINDPGHTCDEYLVLLAKSGMTLTLLSVLKNSFTHKLASTYCLHSLLDSDIRSRCAYES
jgi:hypothetical protein